MGHSTQTKETGTATDTLTIRDHGFIAKLGKAANQSMLIACAAQLGGKA